MVQRARTPRIVKPCMPERVLWNPDYPGPACLIEAEDVDADPSWMGWVSIPEGCGYCPRYVDDLEARPSWWLSWMVGNTHRPKAIAPPTANGS